MNVILEPKEEFVSFDEIYNADVCDSEPISTVAFMVNDDINDIPDEVKQAFTVFCNRKIASGSK